MSTWLTQLYLGISGAWLAVKIYNKLVIWWQEEKADTMNPYKYEKDFDLGQQIMYYALIVIFVVVIVGIGGLILIH